MITSDLYREEILEHYRSPLNFGRLDSFDVSSKQLNPLCGDEITIFMNFGPSASSGQKSSSKEKVIKEIRFFGKGCAISVASASILTDFAKGKLKEQLTKFSEKDMLRLLGIQVSETRKKCALLALGVLKDCL